MAAVPVEAMSQGRSEPANQLASEVDELLRSCSGLRGAVVVRDPVRVAAGCVNNSLQALMNLFYLIARESHLEPQLQPLVTQIQAELAQLSRWVHRLGTHTGQSVVLKEQ